jgi:hypothetical protein
MPKLLHSSETVGCGATIQLDSGEVVFVSVAQTGVLVRLIKSTNSVLRVLVGNFFGPILYKEKNVYKNARTAQQLSIVYPDTIDLLSFNNPVLSVFANAIWHCSSVSEICVVLNEAVKSAPKSDEAAEDAALRAAYNSADDWKRSAASIGLEKFIVTFSDGVQQEITHGRNNVDSWARECNSGNFPYRVVRIIDAGGKIVWGN